MFYVWTPGGLVTFYKEKHKTVNFSRQFITREESTDKNIGKINSTDYHRMYRMKRLILTEDGYLCLDGTAKPMPSLAQNWQK